MTDDHIEGRKSRKRESIRLMVNQDHGVKPDLEI